MTEFLRIKPIDSRRSKPTARFRPPMPRQTHSNPRKTCIKYNPQMLLSDLEHPSVVAMRMFPSPKILSIDRKIRKTLSKHFPPPDQPFCFNSLSAVTTHLLPKPPYHCLATAAYKAVCLSIHSDLRHPPLPLYLGDLGLENEMLSTAVGRP